MSIALVRDGQELSAKLIATPWELRMEGEGASASIAFADADTLMLEARNCDLRLIAPRALSWSYAASAKLFFGCDAIATHYSTVQAGPDCRIEVQAPSADHGEVLLLRGSRVTAALRLAPEEDHAPPTLRPMKDVIVDRRAEVEQWMSRMPAVQDRFHSAAQTGWYLLWACQVGREGAYTRRPILSGKRAMAAVWSWDNCLNALAVASADPALAWDQLLVVLDQQTESGVLPDVMNDLTPIYFYNKPPVWGWTVHRLLKMTPPAERRSYVEQVYPHIVRFHCWWFAFRDWNGDGVPKYMNGNDSGWDNSTIFDEHFPVESPDLTAHLVLQAEGLAEMAELLGKASEAAQWKRESKQLLALFHQTFVTGDLSASGLIYKVLQPEGMATRHSTNLLTRIPILLGHRLRPEVRRSLITDLSDETTFLTPFGPASESLRSARYEPNGYWRGPVWAISTYLIFDGLLDAGETRLAKVIAERFCALCARKAIFSENYNAKTGADQYDSGMPWSSSDFLLMAAWLRRQDEA